jgi:hypothetical protein
VYLIDLDYRMHEILGTVYKGVNGAPEKRCKPIEGMPEDPSLGVD